MNRRSRFLGAFAASLLIGCAPRVPVTPLIDAEAALQQAETADARRYAPFELEQARHKIADARRALVDGDETHARRMAEQAQVDAELAATKARLGNVQATLAEMRAGNANSPR